MLEVVFHFRHGCEVNRLSRRFPDVLIAQWCNDGVEVVELHTREPDLALQMHQELQAIAQRGYDEVAPKATGGSTHLILRRCSHARSASIEALIEREGLLYLPPVVYRDGWEEYRAIAFDEASVGRLFKAFEERGEVKLASKRPMKGSLTTRALMVSAGQLLSQLTEKQASALLGAIEHGYYRVPRRIRTEDIAKRRRVPRTTFEEHVRKAESKIMAGMAPYVALYVQQEQRAQAKGKA